MDCAAVALFSATRLSEGKRGYVHCEQRVSGGFVNRTSSGLPFPLGLSLTVVEFVILSCVDVEEGKAYCERYVLEDPTLQMEGSICDHQKLSCNETLNIVVDQIKNVIEFLWYVGLVLLRKRGCHHYVCQYRVLAPRKRIKSRDRNEWIGGHENETRHGCFTTPSTAPPFITP